MRFNPEKSPRARRVVAALIGVLFILGPARAEADSDMLLKVQERAKYLNDYKAMLEHSDASVRSAAIDAALSGDDAELRSMALEVALAGSDKRLQTAALRWLFRERETLPVGVVSPDKPDAAQTYVYNSWHGLVLSELKINEKTDELSVRHPWFTGGSLTRGGFQMTFVYRGSWKCVLDAEVASGTLLTGAMNCTLERGAVGKDAPATQSSVPVRIDLS